MNFTITANSVVQVTDEGVTQYQLPDQSGDAMLAFARAISGVGTDTRSDNSHLNEDESQDQLAQALVHALHVEFAEALALVKHLETDAQIWAELEKIDNPDERINIERRIEALKEYAPRTAQE